MNDTIRTAVDSLIQNPELGTSLNWWMIATIAELIVILFLLFSGRKTNDKKRLIKQQVLSEGDIDYDNVIASSFGAEVMYKDLIRKCHPDRFAPDEKKVAIANDITERLGKHKHDLKKLNELKLEAINKLNINN